jgi:hypothetical protein
MLNKLSLPEPIAANSSPYYVRRKNTGEKGLIIDEG